MGVDKTSSHKKCEYMKTKGRNFKLFISCHIDEYRNKGATDESKKLQLRHSIMDEPKICYTFIASIYDKE